MLFFQQDNAPAKNCKNNQPSSGLRTSPSGSCFGLGQSPDLKNELGDIFQLLMNCLKPFILRGTTLTLLPVKSCLQVFPCYFIYTVFLQFMLIS